MFRPTYTLVNLDALHHNISEIQKLLNQDHTGFNPGFLRPSRILAMVKADAYGHGIYQVTKTCLPCGINYFAVALVEEAQTLRARGITSPLLILGPFSPEAIPVIIKEKLTPAITSLDMIAQISQEARRQNTTAKLHLKVDTGLSRYGFLLSEVIPAMNKILSLPNIEIEGCFTHFAEAEKPHSLFTYQQLDLFNKTLQSIQSHDFKIPLVHAANSAALLALPQSHYDMVRPGLILYGLYPNSSFSDRIKLKPVLSWKTHLARLQSYPAQTSIGYDRTFITKRDSLIATIPVGYGDGYSRSLSNRGVVLIRGKKAQIVGNISMDLTTLDVTDVPEVHLGDEAILIGQQGDQSISVEDLAALAGTISYEILCQIGKRVPRIYYKDGQETETL